MTMTTRNTWTVLVVFLVAVLAAAASPASEPGRAVRPTDRPSPAWEQICPQFAGVQGLGWLQAAGAAAASPGAVAQWAAHDGGGSTFDGTVVEVLADGFRMDTEGMGRLRVVVTASTELEGFGSLSELAVGDRVEVEGTLSGGVVTAAKVELLSMGSGGGEFSSDGTVVEVLADGFRMDTEGMGRLRVVVTASTELEGFGSLSELAVGDGVHVDGTLSGGVVTATKVERTSGGGGDDGGGGDGDGDGDGDGGGDDGDEGGVHFTTEGLVLELLPPDGFRMDDGRTYTVDSMTLYDSIIGSYAGLAEGMFLEVEARWMGHGGYVARRIEYEGEDDGTAGYREVEGTVATVDATRVVLEDGTVGMFTPTTSFEGDADSWEEIRPGWFVEIEGLLNHMGTLMVLSIRSDDPAPPTVGDADHEPGEALVLLVAGADPSVVAARHGATVVGSLGQLGALFSWDRELDDELLAQVEADPDVVAVEPNYNFRDPESERRRFPIVGRTQDPALIAAQSAALLVNLPEAAGVADARSILVAVMDTGVDPCHPYLISRLLPGGLDVVDGDDRPWETRDGIDQDGDGDVDEAAGHGTFVASIIAAAAPRAWIVPYRVLDDDGGGTAYGLALALADAINRGVDVINLSLVYKTRSKAVDALLEDAAAAGIVVVASAGNDGGTVTPFPASDSHVVAVTALREDGTGLADFANRGADVLVAAPGENVYGALDGGLYGTSTGTSMAAPFPPTAPSLLHLLNPRVDPAIVRDALLQAGRPLADGTWSGVVVDLFATVSAAGP